MAKGGFRIGAGRKKGFAALEAEKARELIATKLKVHLEPIVDKAIVQATEGDKFAREWLVDRAYGKAQQPVELSNPDGSLKTIIIKKVNAINSNDKTTTETE